MSLTAEYRCDACGAAAKYRIRSPISEYTFDLCRHHVEYAAGVGQWFLAETLEVKP